MRTQVSQRPKKIGKPISKPARNIDEMRCSVFKEYNDKSERTLTKESEYPILYLYSK